MGGAGPFDARDDDMLIGGSALARHLDALRNRGLRDSTIYSRWRTIMRLRDSLHDQTDTLAVTYDQLVDYLARDLKLESRATEISHPRGFYRWCFIEGCTDADPTVRLVRPRLHRRLPRPMSEPDVALALAGAPRRRVRPAIALAACAGLRACDMHSLDVADLHTLARPRVVFIPEQKGGDEGSVPMSEELARLLAECDLPTSGPLFVRCAERGGGRLPPWNISHAVNRYLHDIGISHTLHTLRHRFGTQTYQASGRDLRQTQELMRHRSIGSTVGYSWVDPGERAEIVDRLPTFG
jgi:integrase/recombinase XerC